jgi:hypothetical protein
LRRDQRLPDDYLHQSIKSVLITSYSQLFSTTESGVSAHIPMLTLFSSFGSSFGLFLSTSSPLLVVSSGSRDRCLCTACLAFLFARFISLVLRPSLALEIKTLSGFLAASLFLSQLSCFSGADTIKSSLVNRLEVSMPNCAATSRPSLAFKICLCFAILSRMSVVDESSSRSNSFPSDAIKWVLFLRTRSMSNWRKRSRPTVDSGGFWDSSSVDKREFSFVCLFARNFCTLLSTKRRNSTLRTLDLFRIGKLFALILSQFFLICIYKVTPTLNGAYLFDTLNIFHFD